MFNTFARTFVVANLKLVWNCKLYIYLFSTNLLYSCYNSIFDTNYILFCLVSVTNNNNIIIIFYFYETNSCRQ